MKNISVSIIIPLYNSESFISSCIESCLSQTYSDIEIIVVDDGSTDNGYKIATGIAKNDKRVRVLHKENGGVSSARNAGLDAAKGKYVCFIDADDCFSKSFVETMVSYMEQYNSDFCFSKNICGDHNKDTLVGPTIIPSSEAEKLFLNRRVVVGCWNKMYKRSALSNIRFREDLFYGEGLCFINQVAHSLKNIVVCEDRLYHYRSVNPDSATTKFSEKKMINGEKSLMIIKDFIANDGNKAIRAWNLHYCLFCMDAMIGIMRDNKNNSHYKTWHKKMMKTAPHALVSKSGLKQKIKIIVALVSPKLFNFLTK
jgi:glycosyltransferase involved in cell wall biosynthesis